MAQRFRVFVSSPSDVPDERLRADLIVDKLSQDYMAELKKSFADALAEEKKRLETAVKSLREEMDVLEAAQKSVGNGRVLAMIQVRDGKVYASSKGVTFDKDSGLIAFQNPKALPFVPILTDVMLRQPFYITGTHFVKEILPPDKFKVQGSALDVSGRTFPPADFSAVVIAFEDVPVK
jgi:hypothetical protein